MIWSRNFGWRMHQPNFISTFQLNIWPSPADAYGPCVWTQRSSGKPYSPLLQQPLWWLWSTTAGASPGQATHSALPAGQWHSFPRGGLGKGLGQDGSQWHWWLPNPIQYSGPRPDTSSFGITVLCQCRWGDVQAYHSPQFLFSNSICNRNSKRMTAWGWVFIFRIHLESPQEAFQYFAFIYDPLGFFLLQTETQNEGAI